MKPKQYSEDIPEVGLSTLHCSQEVVNVKFLTCTDCGTDIITVLSGFPNILLKNYSTTKSEIVSRSKNSRKV